MKCSHQLGAFSHFRVLNATADIYCQCWKIRKQNVYDLLLPWEMLWATYTLDSMQGKGAKLEFHLNLWRFWWRAIHCSSVKINTTEDTIHSKSWPRPCLQQIILANSGVTETIDSLQVFCAAGWQHGWRRCQHTGRVYSFQCMWYSLWVYIPVCQQELCKQCKKNISNRVKHLPLTREQQETWFPKGRMGRIVRDK